jgi:putative hydrolase of the HAD superfamily
VSEDLVAAVLFDLDDTLYPELAFVHGGFRAAADRLARRTGLGRDRLFERMVAIHDAHGRGRIFDTLVAEIESDDPLLVPMLVFAYRSHTPRIAVFEDVPPVLAELRGSGVRLGLVTDGLASVQRRKLEALGLVELFEAVIPTSELGPGVDKRSPIGHLVALDILGVPPSSATYVGNDPRKDFVGARLAGMATVRVREMPQEGGPPIPDRSWPDDADRYLDRFGDLTHLLAERTS